MDLSTANSHDKDKICGSYFVRHEMDQVNNFPATVYVPDKKHVIRKQDKIISNITSYYTEKKKSDFHCVDFTTLI